MARRRDNAPLSWVVAATLVVAMALRILPLPSGLSWFNPDWVLLCLIYWILAAPERIGLGTAWITGFLTDVLTARSLGQHALAYCLVAYCCLRLNNRLRFYPLVQQSLSVGVFLGLAQLVVAWTQEFSGIHWAGAHYWFPVLSGIVIWPLVSSVLQRMHPQSETI